MKRPYRVLFATAIIFICGCSPEIPTLPETQSFPTGPGRIEVRKELGDITGGIGDRHYQIFTSLVYVQPDGSEAELVLHWPTFHKGRSAETVKLRDANEKRSINEQLRDVYVDLRVVDREQFDVLAETFRDNVDDIEAAYTNMLDLYEDPPRFVSINYYDLSMMGRKGFQWSQNPDVSIEMDNNGNVTLRVPFANGRDSGPVVMWVGQVTIDGQELLLCDFGELDHHPLFSPSFEAALKDVRSDSLIAECTDDAGKRLSDYFTITSVPIANFEGRFKAETQRYQ